MPSNTLSKDARRALVAISEVAGRGRLPNDELERGFELAGWTVGMVGGAMYELTCPRIGDLLVRRRGGITAGGTEPSTVELTPAGIRRAFIEAERMCAAGRRRTQ